MHNVKEQTLELVGRALRDGISTEEASAFLSNLPRDVDSVLSEVAHAVLHFVTDADLRARDKAYDAALRAELEGCVETLSAP